MAKNVWSRARQKAVEDYMTDGNIRTAKAFDPDIILGVQPYAGAFSYVLSMANKELTVLSK